MMKLFQWIKKKLKPQFNEAAESIPHADFVNYLKDKFDDNTAREVLEIFKKIGLPAPADGKEFLRGSEGALIFLNPYGLVMRIEYRNTETAHTAYPFDRINDSPWIIQPLASIDAGKATIEIIPGVRFEEKETNSDYLVCKLREQSVNFWDAGRPNTGRVPMKTPKFPDGIPVVIDRLAVRKLSESVAPLKRALETAEAKEAAEAEEKLYAPLRQSLSEAWTDPQKMQQFWRLCQSYVRDGKLVAGWNEQRVHNIKTDRAANTAKEYESKLRSCGSVYQSSRFRWPRWAKI